MELVAAGLTQIWPAITPRPLEDLLSPPTDLCTTSGFLVADARGRVVGRVECPMYGASADTPDALAIRFGFLSQRRRIVPATSIEQIDERTKVIGLRVGLETIHTFL